MHVLQNGYSPGIGTSSGCYPPNFYNHNMYPGDNVIIGLYSPGICPSGYGTSTLWESSTVTTAVCCPSGFDAATSIIGKCKKASVGPKVVAVDATSSTTVKTPFLVYDWAITIAWASGDLVSSTPAVNPATSSTPSSAPSSLRSPAILTRTISAKRPSLAPNQSTVSPHPQPDGKPSGTSKSLGDKPAGGLSTAAKEGIGIGVGIGGILIFAILAGALFLRRRRRREHSVPKATVDGSTRPQIRYDRTEVRHYQYSPVEIGGGKWDQRYPVPKSELEDTNNGQRYRFEMG